MKSKNYLHKKTKTLWLICLAILFAMAGNAQTPTTCSTAVTYTYPVTQTVSSYTNTHYWFKITTPGAGAYQLQVSSGSGKIDKATVYTGSCASLTLFAVDTLLDTTYTSFNISLYNTASTTYYIDLHNLKSSSTFSLSTIRQLYIIGEFSNQSGNPDTLIAVPIGASGAGSYTWNPGGAHTASITPTTTVNITYTVTYTDVLGTLTDTATAKTTNPPLNNCQQVKNGDFEATQSTYNSLNNISWPVGCTYTYQGPGGLSDPKYWTAPTCGTPDYFNATYGTSGGMGVPANFYTTSTPAHGGHAYAGFYTYYGPTNYREYIQSPLTCSLVPGQSYNISYWVSLAPTACCGTNQPSNNIGAYLSTSSVSVTNNLPLTTYTPQVNASSQINNSGSWTQVSGTMVGNGEKWILLGNFYDDAHTNVNPTIVTSYYFIDDITVTPVSPTVTASSCISGSITLTATGAASANTTWYNGVTTYTGNPVAVPSPTAAVTYTCTVIFPSCGICPNGTATVTVQPQTPCSGTQPLSYAPSPGTYTFGNNPGYFASNMTLASGVNYTINSGDVRFAAGTSITIASGATLTVKGSWLHVCDPCNGAMWQGIIVNNGGTLIMEQGGTLFTHTDNIIEDAKRAVYTSIGITAPSYTITHTVFNNDSLDIFIDANSDNLTPNQIYDNVFTCRNLVSHSVSSTNINSIATDIRASTPLHPSTTNPLDKTIQNLRTVAGVYINQVSTAIDPIVVGSSTGGGNNTFDNLDYGIYAYESSLTAWSNIFENLTGNSNNAPATDPFGVGIYINGIDNTLIAGNSSTVTTSGESNTFRDCLIGVYTKSISQVYINNNTFNNETTAITYTNSGTYVTGQAAVMSYSFAQLPVPNPENLQFANNNVQNCAYGYGMGSLKKLTNTNANSLIMTTNTITATAPNYCSYGIAIGQGHAGANAGVPFNAFNITANSITNAGIACIYANNVNASTATSGFLQIYDNTELSLKYNPSLSAFTSPRTAAVSIANSYYTRVTYNQNIKLTGWSNTTPNIQYQGGIYSYQSPNSTINCNTVSSIGEGIIFEGGCGTSGNCWQNNTMDYSKYGFVLRTNGALGNQGSSSYPINNTWGSTSHFTDQTLCDGTNPGTTAPTSVLYLSTLPTVNTFSGSGAAYSNGAGTLVSVTGTNTLTCGSGGNDRIAENNNEADMTDNSTVDSLRYMAMYTALGDTSMRYPVYNTETHWLTQYQISSHLPNLSAVAGYANAKTLALADAAIADSNYTTAQNLVNSFSASNTIESNWQIVDNIVIKLHSDTLSDNDISTLKGIAQQCPHSGGSVVWMARGILDDYYGFIQSYNNDCVTGNSNGEKTQSTTAITQAKAIGNKVIVYPNPSNGKLYISNFDRNSKNANIEVTDVAGKLITKQQSAINSDIVELNLDVNNGVYFIKIVTENGNMQVQKVIINK